MGAGEIKAAADSVLVCVQVLESNAGLSDERTRRAPEEGGPRGRERRGLKQRMGGSGKEMKREEKQGRRREREGKGMVNGKRKSKEWRYWDIGEMDK